MCLLITYVLTYVHIITVVFELSNYLIGKSAPSLFDSLVETSLIGKKYDMPVKGTAPVAATKVISTGQHPMIGIFNITKVFCNTIVGVLLQVL